MQLKDKDVFRWRYKVIPPNSFDPYWCKSCICIAKQGRLVDTFWSGNDNCTWTYAEAEKALDLTFLGNLDDFEAKPEYLSDYYALEDCINLNHSNSPRGNFYVRKWARRSAERMLEVLTYSRERQEHHIESAKRRLEQMDEALTAINSGADLDNIYLMSPD